MKTFHDFITILAENVPLEDGETPCAILMVRLHDSSFSTHIALPEDVGPTVAYEIAQTVINAMQALQKQSFSKVIAEVENKNTAVVNDTRFVH